MEPKVKFSSLLTTTLVISSFLLLVGCAPSKIVQFKQDMMVQGVKPLSGGTLKKLMTNATQHEKHPTKYEGEFHYSADGTADGKIWGGAFGEKVYIGIWYINDKGAMCQKWEGKENCYLYYPGKGNNEYTRVQLSGPQSMVWPDGLTPVIITPEM